MPDYHDETNRGKIWKNKKKDPENPEYRESLPDFTGELDVDGIKYFLDAWKRKPEANPLAPALNLKIKRREKQPDPMISTGPPKKPGLDDDIPF